MFKSDICLYFSDFKQSAQLLFPPHLRIISSCLLATLSALSSEVREPQPPNPPTGLFLFFSGTQRN